VALHNYPKITAFRKNPSLPLISKLAAAAISFLPGRVQFHHAQAGTLAPRFCAQECQGSSLLPCQQLMALPRVQPGNGVLLPSPLPKPVEMTSKSILGEQMSSLESGLPSNLEVSRR